MVHRLLPACILLTATALPAQPLPDVASINLCTDQLLLTLADPSQIRSLSWLSADPAESMLADQAKGYPLNFGTAEEVMRVAPDVVLGGTYTNSFTRALLADLGYEVVTVAPAASIADIARNLRQVARAIGREARGEAVVEEMRARVARIERSRRPVPVDGIVIRPGGFTVGSGTLADDLMSLAGLVNVAARDGLDAWGSLSIESLLTSGAELLVFTGYRREQPSIANEYLAHPLMTRIATTHHSAAIDAAWWSCGIPASLESAERLVAAVTGSDK